MVEHNRPHRAKSVKIASRKGVNNARSWYQRVADKHGNAAQVHGSEIDEDLRRPPRSTSGARPQRNVRNFAALATSDEITVCESLSAR